MKRGFSIDTGLEYAVKLFFKEGELEAETSNLIGLNHENIIKIFHCGQDTLIKSDGSTTVVRDFVVQEIAKGGTLFDFVALRPFSEPVAREFFRQLITGMNYLHSNGVVHRDIKPENLLLSEDFTLKIADFGHSKSMLKMLDSKTRTFRGTEGYNAPEIFA